MRIQRSYKKKKKIALFKIAEKYIKEKKPVQINSRIFLKIISLTQSIFRPLIVSYVYTRSLIFETRFKIINAKNNRLQYESIKTDIWSSNKTKNDTREWQRERYSYPRTTKKKIVKSAPEIHSRKTSSHTAFYYMTDWLRVCYFKGSNAIHSLSSKSYLFNNL